jgi:hypothetical protein
MNEPTPEQEPEPKPEPEAKPATATEIAEAVAKAIAPPKTGMSAEQVEAEWQRVEAETGKTRAQILQEDNARREANLRDNLPLYERVGITAAKEELDDAPELVEEVKEYMSKFPANIRANEQAWKDAAAIVYVKNKKAGKLKTKAAEPREPSQDKGKVMGGSKVNPGLTEGGRSAAPKPKTKQYDEFEQHVINRTFHGDADAYEAARARKNIEPKAMEINGDNRADLELKRLTGGVRV